MIIKNKSTMIGAALVVGGGVGGMQAALDLAEAGIRVYLLEEKPAIGGKMVELDKTFPTNDCAMCTVSPRLVAIDRHPNIELLTYSKLLGYDGEPGNYKVKILKKARYIDETKCTGCNICIEKCPYKADSEFNHGLDKRKAIYTLYPQAVPNVPVIDTETCVYFKTGKCKACQKFCEANAVCFDQQDKTVEISVGAIVLTPGYELFDPRSKPQLGYGRYPNVLTSLEFERMLSASGPSAGEVTRRSDKNLPRSLAFIQCVGSRETGADFCSAVCCMYSTKEAIVLKEHHPEIDVAIFYIDLRAYGKGFEAYYERAKQLGVRYIRCQPSSLKQIPGNKEIVVRYQSEDNRIVEEKFGIAVLACGMRPAKSARELADIFDVHLDENGFAETRELSPVVTAQDGIFVAGAFSGPKDIPETVVQSSAAAANALVFLNGRQNTQIVPKEFPSESDISSSEPKIGVFVCHCGKNIAGVVDISTVKEFASTLPGVGYVDDLLFACASDAGKKIKQAIELHNLNRIVVAACTPRTHEGLFQDTLRQASLNPRLLEIANIRNQCAWVHMKEPALATQKAKDLIRLSTVRARHLQPLTAGVTSVTREALVIGAGMAGMTAALALADQSIKTYLLEKTAEIGGGFRKLKRLPGGQDPKDNLHSIIERVKRHENIELYTNSEIARFDGSVGNFNVEFNAGEGVYKVKVGAVIVATGAHEHKPIDYLYGKDDRVITQLELESILEQGLDKKIKNIVMIQCVGSRDENHRYCSRLCCIQAIKNANIIKKQNPSMNVFMLYRDIRSYSLHEADYTRARKLGVRFIRFEVDNKPEVNSGASINVRVFDQMLGARLNIPADLVVLAAGVEPNDESALSQKLKVPVNEDGFFMEAHIKLRPVEFATDGIFLCGLAHSPKPVDETIAQAQAAAARAAAILSKGDVEQEACVSEVLDENCDGCAYCIDPCPYGAITLIEYATGGGIKKTVDADPAKCHGCGVCMATCPKRGIMVRNFDLDQMGEMVSVAVGAT